MLFNLEILLDLVYSLMNAIWGLKRTKESFSLIRGKPKKNEEEDEDESNSNLEESTKKKKKVSHFSSADK